MDEKLHLKAAYGVKAVYAGNCHDVGSTEWASTIFEHEGQRYQLLAIGGTDELLDWFWNLFMVSWDGVKICNYLSAHMIHSGTWGAFENVRKAGLKIATVARRIWGAIRRTPPKEAEPVPVFIRETELPLVVAVHSKSAPTGFYWKKKFGADLCLGFSPARGCRKAIPLPGTILYIDPDDPVPQLGRLNFTHPDCEVVMLPDDPGWRIGDHPIDHIIKFLTDRLGGFPPSIQP